MDFTANDIDFDLPSAREWYVEMLTLSLLSSRAKASLDAMLFARAELAPCYHGVFHLGFLWYCHTRLRFLLDDPNDIVVHQKVASFIAAHDAIMLNDKPSGTSEARSAEWWLRSYQRRPGFLLDLPHDDVRWVHDTILASANHFIPMPMTTSDEILRQWTLGLDLIPLAAPPAIFDKNSQMLRDEYGHLGDAEWDQRRRAFLTKILAAPVIYQHISLRLLFEDRARDNLRRST